MMLLNPTIRCEFINLIEVLKPDYAGAEKGTDKAVWLEGRERERTISSPYHQAITDRADGMYLSSGFDREER